MVYIVLDYLNQLYLKVRLREGRSDFLFGCVVSPERLGSSLTLFDIKWRKFKVLNWKSPLIYSSSNGGSEKNQEEDLELETNSSDDDDEDEESDDEAEEVQYICLFCWTENAS